jgi:putative nucleotidyltransferase with HDIG domain
VVQPATDAPWGVLPFADLLDMAQRGDGLMAGLLGIAELQPDMVLAGDLRAYNGRLLLPKGVCLSTKHIKIMKMWGVVEAHVNHASSEDQHPPVSARRSPAGLSRLQQKVRKRFYCVPLDHPVISELYRCALERLAGNEPVKPSTGGEMKMPAMAKKGGFALAGEPFSDFFNSGTFWDKLILPSLPGIFFAINETIMNPRSSAYEIAAVIGKDTGLTARLLKIANSAFYGFPTPIDSIQRAVTVVGAKQLTTLSYAMNIIDAFKNISTDIVDMASFWRHSIACGICARILAGYKNIQNTERLFVAGLLHDIGRLILYQHASADMGRLLVRARSDGGLLYKLEHETLNCDHMTVGAHLVKNWKLPAMLEDVVSFHHTPQNSRNSIEATIVHIADIMTNAMGVGSSGESLVPPLDLQAWEKLGLSEHTLTSAIQQMDQQMTDVFNICFPDEKKTTRQYH